MHNPRAVRLKERDGERIDLGRVADVRKAEPFHVGSDDTLYFLGADSPEIGDKPVSRAIIPLIQLRAGEEIRLRCICFVVEEVFGDELQLELFQSGSVEKAGLEV